MWISSNLAVAEAVGVVGGRVAAWAVGFFFELIILLNFRAALETACSIRHIGVPANCLVILRLVLAFSFSAVAWRISSPE